jgi:hypothetical protein
MDCRTEHEASLEIGHVQRVRGKRIDHHRRSTHRRDADQHQGQLRLADAPFTQGRGQRHRRAGSADRHRAARQRAERAVEIETARSEDTRAHRRSDDRQHTK